MHLIDDTLTAPPPDLTEDDVRLLLRRDYGAHDTQVHRLASERDANFRILGSALSAVLKVSNAAEPHAVSAVQSAILDHLAADAPDLGVPRVIPTRDGRRCTVWSRRPGAGGHLVRLFSLVPGARIEGPLTSAQALALGRTTGMLSRSLARATIAFAESDILWDITRTDRIAALITHLDQAQDRAAVTWAIDRWQAEARATLAGLPVQVCHNDINRSNVLYDAATHELGVIDFGDAIMAPAVVDLANAIAYFASADRLADDAATILAGYRALRPLHHAEIACLPALIGARLAMIIAITGWRARLHPGNRAYIMRNCAAARANLQALMRMAPSALSHALFDAEQPQ
jgi:hydroxylysine kinase